MAEDPITPQDSGAPGGAEAPAMQLIYANASGLRGGTFDVSLEFGYQVPPGQDEAPQPPIWQARVAMSWEHARALHTLLGEQLEKYEAQVGKLPNIEKMRIGEPDDNS